LVIPNNISPVQIDTRSKAAVIGRQPQRGYGALFLMLLSCLFLSACGFKPMYVQTGPKADGNIVPFEEVYIANIPDRNGQYLRNRLIDTIYIDGVPHQPRYRMDMNQLREDITPLGIRKDETATSAQMRVDVQMILYDTRQDKIVLTRNLVATNSFNQLSSQYTTNVTAQYARERVLDDLARQAVTHLALYFQRDQ